MRSKKAQERRIRAVFGDVEPDVVEWGLMHEHTVVPMGKESLGSRAMDETLAQARRRLIRWWRALIERRCNTVVEATMQNRRFARFTQELARATGMNVVLVTGHYTESSIPEEFKKLDVDGFAQRMYEELVDGVLGTDIRAGSVKVSSGSWELRPNEEKAFRAAAAVFHKLGVPITTHSYPGLGTHARFFAELKVDPGKVALGHADACTWLDIIAAARLGVRLLFTNIGGSIVLPEDIIALKIAHLVRKGYVKQVLMGSDNCLFIKNGELKPYFPHPPAYLFDKFVPMLIKAGVKPGHIERIFGENVRDYLAF